jgi:DNA polymerase-3 subunit epsilon
MLVGQRSFEDLGAPLYEVPFCVLDLETTGGSPTEHEITEIGAVRVRGGQLEGTFQTLVNPGSEIPPFITVLTGITHLMVAEAPRIEAVLGALLEFVGDAVIVGHNVRFDLGFLNAAASRLGYPRIGKRSVDTLALARRLVRSDVRRLDLRSLAAYFRSPVEPCHRALDDAQATAHVLHGLLERAGTLGVVALEDLLTLPTARGSPQYQKIALADALPRRPGVYLFVDRDGAVFYVGKAKNLRNRVRSYFYGDRRRSVSNMLRELHRVEYRPCETELEAAITELRLIHAHRPRHNRRSRPPKTSLFLKLTSEQYPRLSLVRALRDDGLLFLGPFRSRRAAELVRLAVWDALPLRRCAGRPGSSAAPCSYAQLGVAMCPCDGTLPVDQYRPVVETLIRAIDRQPSLLLERLTQRVSKLADDRRFEEAALTRDRYRALARSIERRRAWEALRGAGLLQAETASGETALIDHGRLVATWTGRKPPPLQLRSGVPDLADVPPSVQVAEEADLIWRWLADSRAVITAATGALTYPVEPVPELRIAI